MERDAIATIIDTLKKEGIDLVVTLPEEPTSPLTEAIRRDPYFTSVTVAGEGHGIALCAGASLCSTAQSAALTVIPGAVFSGSADGGIRAYATKDGSILWEFDTNRPFDTINGVKANGGSFDGPGAIVVDGILYVTSGNGGLVGRAGNVLLAFSVE